MKFKQLFCNHIWKLEERKTLYFTNSRVRGFVYNEKEHFAVRLVCLKCNKEKWEEKEIEVR